MDTGKDKMSFVRDTGQSKMNYACRQCRLLTWNWFIGQFVYPVGGEGMG